jgi:hypothetical protein
VGSFRQKAWRPAFFHSQRKATFRSARSCEILPLDRACFIAVADLPGRSRSGTAQSARMSPLNALIFRALASFGQNGGPWLRPSERPGPWWSRSRSRAWLAGLRLAREPHRPRASGAALWLAIHAIENLADRPQIACKRQIDELAGDQLRHRHGAAVGRLGLAGKLRQQNFLQPAVGTTGARTHAIAHQW